MSIKELVITPIGNSKGIRLPASTLRRYKITKTVLMEERPDEIILKPKKNKKSKLSWKETFQAMARAKEDWSDLDVLVGEGLDES